MKSFSFNKSPELCASLISKQKTVRDVAANEQHGPDQLLYLDLPFMNFVHVMYLSASTILYHPKIGDINLNLTKMST